LSDKTININGYQMDVFSYNSIIVGTGAAGFNAADRLYSYGQKDIAVVTDHINAGTSRNTGSDKQTYYKLTLSGDEPDSIAELAQSLFAGQCVDGDIALAEAALSAQCFLRLVELGVPFPQNRYGEYVGYKTDHDPRKRATSVGPYTSKMMTECLERSVLHKDIHIFDKMQVVKILTDGTRLCGLLCLNLAGADDKSKRFTVFVCKNVIYATGGPAGMYADSAYPFGHYGATGLAFDAGVMGENLTEWQYGLASVKPRWNVSGTYMQVLPKFISTDLNGGDEREFLLDFFTDYGEMLDDVFLKGYQWPFDVRKIDDGSSVIDLLVYMETCIKGRRVFLDFRQNPQNRPVDFTTLSDEPREYLEKAGAAFGTPIERLMHMNSPAMSFYMDNGIDLSSEPLEIALCAQHNNGGLSIDKWWQTNLEGFFVAGEAAGSHGVYRPGGSALNAGQVGSTRAAQYITRNCQGEPMDLKQLLVTAADQIKSAIAIGEQVVGEGENVQLIWDEATRRMSLFGAAIRSGKGIQQALSEIKEELLGFAKRVRIKNASDLSKVFRLYDTLICQYVYLSAMVNYADNGGKSRGSALYSDYRGRLPYDNLPEIFRFTLDDGSRRDMVQEVVYQGQKCFFTWRRVREIPQNDDFFENVWRSYRENGNIY
jgi:succinate dehydrogenase / fumarate reductase flavoprotein subunit